MFDLKRYKNFDWVLLGTAVAIFSLGILFLSSATYPNNAGYVTKQISWFLLGLAVLISVMHINYRKIVGFSFIFYFLVIVLLLVVLVFGSRRFGARRWIEFGFFNMQPSEFAKLFVMLALVQYLTTHRMFLAPLNIFDVKGRSNNIIISFIIVLVPFVLILLEPDLGTALILIPILFILLYVRGIKFRRLFFITLAGLAVSPLGWFLLRDYQRDRLMVFIDPNIDPLGAGYTIIQSKIAIGSGGMFGKGYFSGTQNQLNFLAERHTDFIFSVVGEEWGFFGGVILVGLFYLLMRRVFLIAKNTHDPCGRLLAVGIAAMLSMQVIVNISMTMGFMPVVGLPLPLVSYGGSSLLVTMISLGLLESIAMHR